MVMVYDVVAYVPGGQVVARYRVSEEAAVLAWSLARREMARGLYVRVRLVEWGL